MRPKVRRRRVVPWSSLSFTIERKQAQAARRRYQRCNDDEALRKEYEILYRKLSAKFKRLVRRAKWAHYLSIFEEIEPGNPFGPHFDWVRGWSSNYPRLKVVERRDADKTVDFSSTVEELMQYHFPRDTEVRPVHREICNSVHELAEDDPEFTLKVLEAIFRTLNKGKAP